MNEITSPASTEPLLTVREVADLLRLSEPCVYTMVAGRRLPHLRVGNGRGSIRFSRQDIERFLENCRTSPAPKPPRPVRVPLKHLKLPRR